MKRLVILLQALVLAAAAFAVPARPGTMKVTQKDGTVLTVRLVGDEHMSYFINEANGQKMYRADDGDLKPLAEQHFMQMKTRAAERRAHIEQARAERMAKNRAAASHVQTGISGSHKVGGVSGGMTGNKKGLVILVNFQDVTFSTSRQDFDDQFNKEGYNKNYHLGSVHDYFYDQSYGNFDLTFDVVGPVTVSQNMAYYGARKGGDSDSYPGTMVREACQLVNDEVNFADYDWDGDGWVDQVFVVYAGYGEAQGGSSNTIWPHEWQLNSAAWYGDGEGELHLDGVIIDTYACSCELSGGYGTTMDGIGTACHEFSHCLGYPDFYDGDYSGGWGMGSWDVMCSGSYNGYSGRGEGPCGYTSYERWLAGWLDPVELTDGKTVTDMQPLNDSPEAYILYNDKNPDEFLMFENRKNDKWFKYMPSGRSTNAFGLLVTHVDYNAAIWEANTPNDDPNHQRMTIIPANKRYDSNYYNHPFSGSSSVSALTPTSHSSAGGKWWKACSTGSTALNHEITDITYNRSTKTVSFLFDGGDAFDDGNRYTVTYVPGSGTCDVSSWTQQEWREEPVLPTAVGAKPDYYFVGWSRTDVTKTAELPVLIQPDEKLKLDSDINLYAVYKYLYSPSSDRDYKLTTTINKDNDYLFVSSNKEGEAYVLDLDSLLASEGAVAPRVTVKRAGSDLVISNPVPTSVWHCDYASGSSTRRLSNDGRYMSISAAGIRYSESVSSICWSATSGLYAISGTSRYYLHPDADGTFIVNKTTGNPVYAYELVGERPTTYYANTFNYYTLTYLVDSVQYKQFNCEAGKPITPAEEPEAREGYTFSGWNELPDVMPAHDIDVHGYFLPDAPDAISAVGAARSAKSVYSLHGVLLNANATPYDLQCLPAGIYIVGGRKVVKP